MQNFHVFLLLLLRNSHFLCTFASVMQSYVHILEGLSATDRPLRFTFPFSYTPHPWAQQAAEEVMAHVRQYMADHPDSELHQLGKMFGVLVVETPCGQIGYLRAFSAMLDGRYHHSGYVPPIVDLSRPDGYFKQEEQRISAINQQIAMANPSIDTYALKTERKTRSQALQRWMFSQYQISNRLGQKRDLMAIFQTEKPILSEEDFFSRKKTAQGFAFPPSGAGECCAPKLLQMAFKCGLQPLCMAEFWMGASPKNELRTAEQYYPACMSKCRPILRHMLEGIDLDPDPIQQSNQTLASQTVVLYSDPYFLAVNKPAGLLTVPSAGSEYSLVDWLQHPDYLPVHRLDMDTSGIVLIAKTAEAYRRMQQLFLSREVTKRYEALIRPLSTPPAPEGRISLPLMRDPFDRPRQRVDYAHGKTAITAYRVLEQRDRGTLFVALFPETGRTHQLRVHMAHIDGLHAPILGDRLYGDSRSAPRLMLHAAELQFEHPFTHQPICISCPSRF